MKISKFIPQNIKSRLGKTKYNIGFLYDDPNAFLYTHTTARNIKWLNMNGYRNGWFADPFLLDVTDNRIIVLVEEFVYDNRRGRLSQLTIDRKTTKLLDVSVVLELSTHLSFPYIIRKDKRIYIMPENNQSGKLWIYEYDERLCKCVNPKVVIERPLIDAQYLPFDGKHYIFAQDISDGIMTKDFRVYIYRSDDMFGNYELFQVIENNRPEMRGAGEILSFNRKLIRPVQSCIINYGHETIFKEISYSNDRFEEHEIGRLPPNRRVKMPLQLHTFNSLNDCIVIDGNRYNNSFIHQFTKVLNK